MSSFRRLRDSTKPPHAARSYVGLRPPVRTQAVLPRSAGNNIRQGGGKRNQQCKFRKGSVVCVWTSNSSFAWVLSVPPRNGDGIRVAPDSAFHLEAFGMGRHPPVSAWKRGQGNAVLVAWDTGISALRVRAKAFQSASRGVIRPKAICNAKKCR